MAGKELGQKRSCTICGSLYYDLGRVPPTCPSCNSQFELKPNEVRRVRRSRQVEQSVSEADQIQELASNYRITKLCHFTRLENLRGILEFGILPRSESQNLETIFINDEDRHDHFLAASSFSISFPNYKLLTYFRKVKFPDTKWVVLGVRPDLMWTHRVLFSTENAATSSARGIDPEQRATATYFASLFADFEGSKNGQPYTIERQSLKILPNFTTNPQAEVLIFGKIPQTAITTVHFQSSNDLEAFQTQCVLPNDVKLEVGSNLFSYRDDYSTWKSSTFADKDHSSEDLDDEFPF